LTVQISDGKVGVTRNNILVEGIDEVTFKLTLDQGWNLISFPGDVIEPSSPDGFPENGITQILNADDETPDAFELGEAYWALAVKETEKEVKLIPQEIYTLKINRSWNMIGSVYGEACKPEGVVQLNHWNAMTKEYEIASRIELGAGYLALALQDSEITVDTKPCHPAPKLRIPKTAPIWTLPIQVTDANSRTTTHLTVGVHPDAKLVFDSRFDVAFPPQPPGEDLTRPTLLSNGNLSLELAKKILPVPKTGKFQFILQVKNPKSDAVLSWDATKIPDSWSLVLIDKNKQIDMKRQSTYSTPKGEREIILEPRSLSSQQALPQNNALWQNYPNPFNPETWIPYQLSSSAEVYITIYDFQGQIVRKLSIGKKSAGIYTDKHRAAVWDGRNEHGEHVSSGVYFYQLETVSPDGKVKEKLATARKMVIIK